MNQRQANPGHVLVIPRRHLATVFGLDAATAAALGRATQRIAGAVRSAMESEDLNIWQSNGVAAGQEIFHLHVHVFPRKPQDGWFRVYPEGKAPPILDRSELSGTAEQIRRAM